MTHGKAIGHGGAHVTCEIDRSIGPDTTRLLSAPALLAFAKAYVRQYADDPATWPDDDAPLINAALAAIRAAEPDWVDAKQGVAP